MTNLRRTPYSNKYTKTTKCKSCGAYIVWMKTQRDKNIPVDADTVTDGDEIFDRTVHVAHFDTCPDADKFRRPAK